jgi:hypothetical protein
VDYMLKSYTSPNWVTLYDHSHSHENLHFGNE